MSVLLFKLSRRLLTSWRTRWHRRSTVAGSGRRSPAWPPTEHDTRRPESRVRPALVYSYGTLLYSRLFGNDKYTNPVMWENETKRSRFKEIKTPASDTSPTSSIRPPLSLPRSAHTSPQLATSVTCGNNTVEFITASSEGRFLLYCR